MVNALAAPQFLQNPGFLVDVLRRKQDRDRFTDYFRRAIAEHPLGAVVPRRNRSVEGLADNGIVGGLDDGGQIAVHLVRLRARIAEGLLHCLAISDIFDDADKPLAFSADCTKRRESGAAPDRGTVLADIASLEGTVRYPTGEQGASLRLRFCKVLGVGNLCKC